MDGHLYEENVLMDIEPTGLEKSSEPFKTNSTKTSANLILGSLTEKTSLSYASVHKLWSLITLNSVKNSTALSTTSNLSVDFVVIIDISASMGLDSKLAFVKATIEYLLSKLTYCHRFSLIVFNQSATLLAGLLNVTEAHKKDILDLLRDLEASGSTNVAEALFQGLTLLSTRPPNEISRMSSVLLFTDGLSNRGLSCRATIDAITKIDLPSGCVVNTFGFGKDHDSKLLHAIAMRAKGVYYYIENQDAIAATFGECLAGILSTEAYNIVVKMRAQDGSRIVSLATPFPIIELKIAKDYDVHMGTIYSSETKSILFKLSLRKMDYEMMRHNLVKISVEYVNVITGAVQSQQTEIYIKRPNFEFNQAIPIALDQHINRYSAAVTITEAIDLSKRQRFEEAQYKINSLVLRIENSPSASEPYCQDLIKDLRECASSMKDSESFAIGIHSAHAYSAMYYTERSTGSSKAMDKNYLARSVGYGYVTMAQEAESRNAVIQARSYVGGYCLSL